MEPTSDIGAHCLNLKLGSLAEERFNNRCQHGEVLQPPPPVDDSTSEECLRCQKTSQHHCTYCDTSFCKEHLAANVCRAGELPKKFGPAVVCTGCLCKTAPKQSVETHSAWFLIPPKTATGIDWDMFPEDVQYVEAQKDGFRGFIVEFYNIISDVVVQDGYQSVLNLRTVLKRIQRRHPRIRW